MSWTDLDHQQVIKTVYDGISDSLKVNVVAGAGAALDTVDLMDTPVLDGTLVPASSSSPLQVVASLAEQVRKIQCLDTTGYFIGVYEGPPALEVLKFIIGPGSDQIIEVNIPQGTRISVRNMENVVPTSGSLVLNFLG